MQHIVPIEVYVCIDRLVMVVASGIHDESIVGVNISKLGQQYASLVPRLSYLALSIAWCPDPSPYVAFRLGPRSNGCTVFEGRGGRVKFMRCVIDVCPLRPFVFLITPYPRSASFLPDSKNETYGFSHGVLIRKPWFPLALVLFPL